MKVYILVKEYENEYSEITNEILGVFSNEESALEEARKKADETHDYLLEDPGETTINKIYISEIEEGFGKGFETGVKAVGFRTFKDGSWENAPYEKEEDHIILEFWRYSVEEWEVQE